MSVIYDIEDHERFRAQLASVEQDGRRKWIYARQPSGRLYKWRTVVAAILLVFFVASPFVYVRGHQFMLLNLLERKFVLFGMPFWPQDMWLLVLVLLLCIVSIVLLTATVGRIWCGWMCPQTIFLEMVFRRLEWFIEGPPAAQVLRRSKGWTRDRVVRGLAKHSLFAIIAFGIANVFLAYLISSKTLLQYVADGPFAHLSIIIPLVLFSFVFYAVFARFREQACVIVCPYGRYMSSLVDDKTLTVTYDTVRGEQRGKGRNRENLGDCVDCHQCVTVCPTGIDIRNGIQLECVQCTACIDACNDVMRKTKQPEGLIRYTSGEAVRENRHTWLTGRIVAYTAIWLVLVGVVAYMFAIRTPYDVAVLRFEGTTWLRTSNGIANIYRLEITNRTSVDGVLTIRTIQPDKATVAFIGMDENIEAYQQRNGRFIVTIPDAAPRSTVNIELLVNGIVQHVEKLPFLTPPAGATK